MEYLFFDIECATCAGNKGKICEFGYVLTDEAFAVKEKGLLLVNPRSAFDWYVIKNMLAFRKEDYLAAPDYPAVYPKIAALFARKDLAVFGHTMESDAKFLNDEAERYGLPYLSYGFCDVKYMHAEELGIERGMGVEKLGEILGSARAAHVHRSVDDAEATMEVVKTICARLGADVPALVARCPECVGKTDGGILSWQNADFHRKKTKK